MEETKSLGQIAFEASCRRKNNLDVRGAQIPAWKDIDDEVQDAWQVGVEEALIVRDGDMWRRICQMRLDIISMKSESRTEKDRRIAVAVTKFEDFLSWYNTMIIMEFTGEIHD